MSAQKRSDLSEAVLKYYSVVRREISTSGSDLSYTVEKSLVTHAELTFVPPCRFLGGAQSQEIFERKDQVKKTLAKILN